MVEKLQTPFQITYLTSFIVESTNGESIGWFWITSLSSCEILDQEHTETLTRIYQTKKKNW